MSFLTELEVGTNKAQTRNGAISNKTTLNPLLDFFSKAGAMRGSEADAVALFNKAYASDPTGAMRCLFYLRDIRGGQGERSVFRAILESMSQVDVNKVVKFIPEYGRWDEVPYTTEGLALIKKQFEEDQANLKANKPVSLLAKWLPSDNASSKESKTKARIVAEALGLVGKNPILLDGGRWIPDMTPYRKEVVKLRKHIALLEQKMSAKEWAEIQYDKLPSQAHRKHVKAFKRHDESRYTEYLGAVVKGEKKINTSTLFTYEVYNMVNQDEEAANAMWQNLPDYTNGENALVLADVSGSMSWGGGTPTPMSVAVSLALYFAERNEGVFKDYFMTFTDNSRLQKVSGSTLRQKMNSIERADWGGSTSIQSAFDAILRAATKANAPQSELPKVLYIISDMQFNEATDENDVTNFEEAERKFREAGYELPHLVFWNVNAAYGNDTPATMHDNRVTLISGSNQSTFQYAVAGKTPMESMLDILGSERYSQIVL